MSKPDKRQKEIEDFYVKIGLGDEETRKYMTGLSSFVSEDQAIQKSVVFIEAGINSISNKDFINAGLEPNS